MLANVWITTLKEQYMANVIHGMIYECDMHRYLDRCFAYGVFMSPAARGATTPDTAVCVRPS